MTSGRSAERVHVTGALAESARVWLDAGRPEGSPARPAATVMLMRGTGPERVELFMMRRVASMTFAGSMWVFPGGGVDPRDASSGIPWAGPSQHDWAEAMRLPVDEAAALVVAAAREVFEECGVLLAGVGDEIVADVRACTQPDDRARLLDRSWSFGELLRERGLTLRTDLLRLADHWITPEFEPRRYDTWFFRALMPAGQLADDATTEADLCEWVQPGDLLAMADRGDAGLLPPTRVQLEWAGRFDSAADAFAADRTVRTIMPVPESEGDDIVLVTGAR